MTRRTPFAALLGSYVISVAGTSMSAIAIPWLVLASTGSAAITGLVAFAQMAPYVAAQVLAGPLVDRLGLRRSFIGGNLMAALAVGAIPAASGVGALTLPVLLSLVAVAGVIRGAADCASTALLPATAEAAGIALERAAGLAAGANRAAMLLGAPLAGVLITLAGPPVVIAIDAATFAVAAGIAAAWVRVAPAAPAPPASEPAPRRYRRDLAAGLHFLAADRLLLGIVAMVGLTNLLDQGLAEVMLPVWVREEIGSAGALGLIAGVGGAGSVLGNLLGAWLGPRLSRRALYSVGFLASGAPRFIVLALTSTLVPALTVFLISDIFGGSLNSVIGATSYERIPEHLRARVLGAIRASAWIGIPFGALLGGYATETLGARPALLTFGAAYLLTTLTPRVFPAWRQMQRAAPATTDEAQMVVA